METLFLQIVNMSITGSYVILALLFIRLLLKKAPKKYSYLLWAAAFFRLACPVSFSAAFSLFQIKPFNMAAALRGGSEMLTYIPPDIGRTASDAAAATSGIPFVNTVLRENLSTAAPDAGVIPVRDWILAGAVLWLVGIGALLAYHVVTGIRLKRRMDTAVRLENDVFESDKTRSPFILGFFRPRIYIPFGLSEQEKAYILQHERFHIRRKDPFVKLAGLFVWTLHWFNPLVWLAYSLMVKDMEMSCDERVLSQTRENIAGDYSLSLLSFAANRRFPAASPLAFGEIGIRGRVKNILRFKKPSRRVMIGVAGICAAAVAVCIANPKISEAVKNEDALYGNYAFEHLIYMTPISSYFVSENHQEFYTLTSNSLTVINISGERRQYSLAYEKTAVDKESFRSAFLMDESSLPDLDSYRECWQLTSDSGSSGYRLYQMDDELWLARIQSMNTGANPGDYFWSIYRIVKYTGEFPVKTAIYATKANSQDFLSLQGDFFSGYKDDVCYDITPDSIRENSEYRIFKYDLSGASFLLYKDEIFPLGEWFGGYGATSLALADLTRDGKKELYFTYSWGSGLHRSHAAYFDPAAKKVVVLDYAHLNGDLLISLNNRDGGLSLYDAKISNMKSFAFFDVEKGDFIADIVCQGETVVLVPDPGA